MYLGTGTDIDIQFKAGTQVTQENAIVIPKNNVADGQNVYFTSFEKNSTLFVSAAETEGAEGDRWTRTSQILGAGNYFGDMNHSMVAMPHPQKPPRVFLYNLV